MCGDVADLVGELEQRGGRDQVSAAVKHGSEIVYLPMKLRITVDEAPDGEDYLVLNWSMADATGQEVDKGSLGPIKAGSSFEFGPLYAKFTLEGTFPKSSAAAAGSAAAAASAAAGKGTPPPPRK